jgi:2-polyprenyl-3-methyl-5-hydroxy-6-metoxy-1,4-benzoquinol methylase
MTGQQACPICGAAMGPDQAPWLFRCTGCGFLRADLRPEINDAAARGAVDEPLRAKALNGLRVANFERILDRLALRIEPAGKRLLDIGCAHGWFLDAAAERGFQAFGLEPDPDIGAAARAGGRTVWPGFFPDDVPAGSRFDVLSFNDVLEHLPDVAGAVAACRGLLSADGILVVNAPSSDGIFYRAAALLARLGLRGPFERMWQVGFASPHLSYFSPRHLRRLVEQAGFVELDRARLPSVRLKGLWARLSYDRGASRAASAIVWLGVAIASPFLGLLPADITLQIFRRTDGDAPAAATPD